MLVFQKILRAYQMNDPLQKFLEKQEGYVNGTVQWQNWYYSIEDMLQ